MPVNQAACPSLQVCELQVGFEDTPRLSVKVDLESNAWKAELTLFMRKTEGGKLSGRFEDDRLEVCSYSYVLSCCCLGKMLCEGVEN